MPFPGENKEEIIARNKACQIHYDKSIADIVGPDGVDFLVRLLDKDPARSLRGGPMVRPGNYQARLTVNGEVLSQTFRVKADPRMNTAKTSIEDLKAQETLALQVVALEHSSKRVAEQVNASRKELAPLIEESKRKKQYMQEDARLAQIEDQLVTPDGIYMTPMLIDQLRYLRSMLNQADQRPGKDAYERYDELKNRFNTILNSYVKLGPKM